MKQTKNQVIVVPSTSKTRTKSSKKIKISPTVYYNCMLAQAQKGWLDPVTGKKKKVTTCCKECKSNAPAINKQKQQEAKKILVSLKKLLSL
ncbi:MAG: hypothetical protein GBAus27B_000228 [Mycoplasmataceae bacterium]|nr:MAG: hypothetical protein GBAus27B_000228 [Mycoplasmataceae bacterium]